MNINSAKFIRGIVMDQEVHYERFPLFAVIGRSNVGKSSFINTITSIKGLAHTGGRPGVTQQVNLFLLNKRTYLADMPGYGYARISGEQRNVLENLIFGFLDWRHLGETQITSVKVFHLVDANVGPTALDLDMREFLSGQPYEVVIIANKADKLKSGPLAKAMANIKKLFPEAKIIPFSSKTGLGKKEVLKEF